MMNRRRIFVSGLVLFLAIFVSLSNFTAKPVYATYSDLTVYKKDPSGNKLQGWVFKLYKKTGYNSWTYVSSKTTDQYGKVRWTDIHWAEYKVCETQQSGWTPKSPTDSNGCQYFTLGASDVTLTFVNIPPTSKIKIVKKDHDGNRLSGWEFKVYKKSDNTYMGSGTTDSNGEAEISGLPAGEYKVCETPKAGWVPDDGYAECQYVTLSGGSSSGTGTAGDSVDTQHYGGGDTSTLYFKNKKVRDVKVYKKDTSGNILGGWEFKLRKYGQYTWIASKTTTDGNPVIFDDLDVGTKYSICEVKQSGWTVQSPTDSSGCQTVTPGSGTDEIVMTFVNKPPSRNIKVVKYSTDWDRLSGWSFTAKNTSTQQVYGPVTTDGNGEAIFTDLPFGTYQICETVKSGWSAFYPDDGCYTVTVNSSTSTSMAQVSDHPTSMHGGGGDSTPNTFYYFNYEQVGKLKVYKKDASDNPLQNWQIQATNKSTNVVYGPVTTNSSGYAYISNLPFGQYEVCEILQPGWTPVDGYSVCKTVTVDESSHAYVAQTYAEAQTMHGDGGGDYYTTVTFKNRLLKPDISIKKYTYGGTETGGYGADADSANDSHVPRIAAGQPVIWYYIVENTGETSFALSDVKVTDDQSGVTVNYERVISGDDDTSLEPNEKWLYKATGTAKELSFNLAGTTTVAGCKTTDQIERPVYRNKGKVQVTNGPSDYDYSHYCNPENPGIDVTKYTNGADANDPNGSDVPKIAPNGGIVWTYKVVNTGNVPFLKTSVNVTDNRGVTVWFDQVLSGDGDDYLEPGEVWQYKATGSALTLTDDGSAYIVDGCQTGQGISRPTYNNVGTVTVTGYTVTDNDPSHYCNPEGPNIAIKKFTNGYDADTSTGNVPQIAPDGTIEWTYVVSNTGNVPFPKDDVKVTDNRMDIPSTNSVVPVFDSYVAGNNDEILEPGEIWLYKATGKALDLKVVPSGADYIVNGCKTAQELYRPTYNNVGMVTVSAYNLTVSDPSHYCNPETPGIDIKKFTNGYDADTPTGIVPQIAPNGGIEWTYVVSNTGNVPFPKANVKVTDNRQDIPSTGSVVPTFDSYLVGDSDDIFEPGEIWLFNANGAALDLTLVPSDADYVVDGCQTGQGVSRPTYNNVGTVTIDGTALSDNDPSHYCNPETPGIDIKKYTNGYDADTPTGNVPRIAPDGAIEWTYVVSNTGNVPFPKANVKVTDNRVDVPSSGSVVPVFDSYVAGDNDDIFEPGEIWLYKATGKALVLSANGAAYIVDGCRTAQGVSRPTYNNIGTVSIDGTDLSDSDPSHYCNPETPGIDIEKYTNGADADDPNGADVPKMAPDGAIEWTYLVTNIGNVPFAEANVVVTDDVLGTIDNASRTVHTGDDDNILEPGESWLYKATGSAEVLEYGPTYVVEGCAVGADVKRPTYENTGTVTVTGGPSDSDDSHYCNPYEPDIHIKKYTNGEDADTPTGPIVLAGSTVTWTYYVTNPGNVVLSNVVVTDNVAGVTPAYISGDTNNDGKLDLTETWVYRTTGIAISGQYSNTGYTTGVAPDGVVVKDDDPSHYFGTSPQLASLGDLVWHDLNANGVQDDGEPGVPNITVNLLAGDCATPMNQSTTDGSGIYGFADLQPGNYCVQFALNTLPAGFKVSPQNVGDDAKDSDANPADGKTQPVTLLGGEQNLTLDMGIYKPAALGDFVWHDTNANGVQDGGESGVQGVSVKLLTNNCSADTGMTAVTDANGIYGFTNLTPGSYCVQFALDTLPEGFKVSPQDVGDDAKDSDGSSTDGKTQSVTLASGAEDLTLDLGIYKPAALGDYVWVDTDEDGTQDADEPPVEHVKVTLFTCADTQAGSPLTTDANGKYEFTNLVPGCYYVVFSEIPSGFSLTTPNKDGVDDALDSDADAGTGKTPSVTLKSGDRNLTLDAGLLTRSINVTATPLCENDATYVQYSVTLVNFSAGDNPLTIRWIDVATDQVLYEFTGQPLTNKVLWPEAGVDENGKGNQWPGWSFTDGKWVDNGSKLRPQVRLEFSVNPTQSVTVDYPPATPTCSPGPRASLGDRVWIDENENGTQDEGEPNQDGVKVTLFTCDGSAVGTPLFTDGEGKYLFTNLVPACYYVVFAPETIPDEFKFTTSNGTGVDDTLDSDADAGTGQTPQVTLHFGEDYRDLDAGLVPNEIPPTNSPEDEQPHMRDLIYLPTLHHE